jgi:hypothetical protein
LFGRKDLSKQILQLNFSPCAASRHVAEDAFEVSNAGCESLHFAEAFVYLLQTFAHKAERLAEACFQRCLQLFIYRLAHLFEFGRVVGLQQEQALIDHSADSFELFLLVALHLRRGRKKAGQQLVRFLAGTRELMGDGGAQGFGTLFGLTRETLDIAADFFTQRAAFLALPLLGAREIVPQPGFKPGFMRISGTNTG